MMPMMPMMALAVFFCGVATGLAQDNPPIRSKEITRPIEEAKPKYIVPGPFGSFTGTVESATPTRVKFRLPSGKVFEVPMFYLDSPPVHHVMSTMAKIPQTVTDHQMEPGRRHLISLDATTLKKGDLKNWKNAGALKGEFIPMHIAPKVVEHDGRRAIHFEQKTQAYAEPSFQGLTSTFTVTDYLDYEAPFTFSILVNTQGTGEYTPMMAWGALGGDKQTVFTTDIFGSCWFSTDIAGLSIIGTGKKGDTLTLTSPNWQYLTYVYSGGHDGTLSIYRDGELVRTYQYDSKVEREPAADITATTATLNGELFSKNGAGSVCVYWGELDHHQWFQMRKYHWEFSQNFDNIPAGGFQAKLKGLKPGTKYYYRFSSYDTDKVSHGYPDTNRRWAYGPGTFVTASEDGKTPGKNLEEDNRQHFFIGANRGSRWYMQSPGPSMNFVGYISKMDVYDYAMDFFEVRESLGMSNAFEPQPAVGGELSENDTTLSWQPGLGDVATYNVYFGIDKEAVTSGTVKPIKTTEPTLEIKGMKSGAIQYWRVAQLDKDGKELTKGALWSFDNRLGRPHTPRPQVGVTVSPMRVVNWSGPTPDVKEQRLYFAHSSEALEAMEKPSYAPLTKQPNQKGGVRTHTTWLYPTPEHLHPGKKVYWRVDFVWDDGRITKGDTWTFNVRDYFTAEVDTIWAKPAYDHDQVSEGAMGCKQTEERVGYPARSSASSPSKVLLDDETIGYSRQLYKWRKLRDRFEFQKSAAKLGWVFEGGSYGGGYFSMSYGGLSGDPHVGEEIFGGNLVMHEYGHQLDCTVPAYWPGWDKKKMENYAKCIDTNRGLGGYGGANIGEEMAMAIHGMSFADGRVRLYKDNRPMYNILRTVLGGDRYIDLNPRELMKADADAKLLSWGNDGGLIKHFGDTPDADGRRGYGFIDNTQGVFSPVGDAIEAVQIGAATAIKLDGKSALLWDERTQLALHDNRDFGADFWVRKQAGSGDAVLAALTGKDGKSFAFKWSDFPGAKEGQWQHLAFTYEGGGDTGDEAGLLRIFVNEKEVVSKNQTFDLPHDAAVSIGGWVKDAATPAVTDGFTGELGQTRIYNYDISLDEVEEHFREESPLYYRTPDVVADKLYVDIDCRQYTDIPQRRHEPFHPDNLRKPWIRSWPNFGTLAGRLHNDVDTFMWDFTGSTPVMRMVDGAKVPVFQGKDRMVGGFKPNAEMVKNPPRTLELWMKRDVNQNLVKDVKEVALEWGDFQLNDIMLDAMGVERDGKWHHVVLLFPAPTTPSRPAYYNIGDYMKNWEIDLKVSPDDLKDDPKFAKLENEGQRNNFLKRHKDKLSKEKGEELGELKKAEAAAEVDVFVDGKSAGKVAGLLRPSPLHRMNVGAHYDMFFWNWRYFFNGAFSAIRVHKGAMTPEQIQANAMKKPQEPDRSTPVELVFDIDAAALPEGKVAEWTYTGSGGGTFKPGNRVVINQPKTEAHFDGKVGLPLSEQALTSSFDIPEAMLKGGPFTIVARVLYPMSRADSGSILNWGANEHGHGGYNFVPKAQWSKIFSWREQVKDENGKMQSQGKSLGLPKRRHHPTIEPDEDEVSPNVFLGFVWKTTCLNYDGKTIRYVVDGKVILESPATLPPISTEKGGKGSPRLKFLIPASREKTVLIGKLQVYPESFTVEALTKATAAIDPTSLKAKPAVDIDFSKLKADTFVKSIKNTGTLGGEFRSADAMDEAANKAKPNFVPTAKTVDGVRVVEFDGKDTFLESDKIAPRTMTDNEPFTFATFIKPGKSGELPSLLKLSENESFGPNGKVEGLRRQKRDGSRGAPRPKTGPWVHAVVTYEGPRKVSKIFIDGKEVDSAYWSAYFVAITENPMEIGRNFGGDIARMQMWRGVKSAEEIAAMAEAAHERVVVDESKAMEKE